MRQDMFQLETLRNCTINIKETNISVYQGDGGQTSKRKWSVLRHKPESSRRGIHYHKRKTLQTQNKTQITDPKYKICMK